MEDGGVLLVNERRESAAPRRRGFSSLFILPRRRSFRSGHERMDRAVSETAEKAMSNKQLLRRAAERKSISSRCDTYASRTT